MLLINIYSKNWTCFFFKKNNNKAEDFYQFILDFSQRGNEELVFCWQIGGKDCLALIMLGILTNKKRENYLFFHAATGGKDIV